MSAHSHSRSARAPANFKQVFMDSQDLRRADVLIKSHRLGGTIFEQMLLNPGGWFSPERFADTPGLMRFAMDLHNALGREGLQFQRVGREYNLRQTKT